MISSCSSVNRNFKMAFTIKLFTVCIIISMLPSANGNEPTCSPFEYDKKLLEKMIRMEISFENIKTKVQSAADNVDKDLKELKSERVGVQSEVEIMKTDNKLMKQELKEFIQTIKENVENKFAILNAERKTENDKQHSEMVALSKQQHAIITRMSADLFALKNETIAELTDHAGKHHVAFRASLSSTRTFSRTKTMVFPSISLNKGDGYDASTGRFTVPVSGTYIVTVHACINVGKRTALQIVIEGNVNTKMNYYEEKDATCYSTTDLIALTNGMQVWIVVGSASSSDSLYFYQDNDEQTFFAAVLLNA